MNPLVRKALIVSLVERLRDAGSWCGETHVQKAVYLLQELKGVEAGFDYVLYKYGPFSFDLRRELEEMRAQRLLVLEPQPAPYGPKLATTKASQRLHDELAGNSASYEQDLDDVAGLVGSRGVGDLEALTTAVLLSRRNPTLADHDLVAALRAVKPHLSEDGARHAVKEARQLGLVGTG